MQARARMTNGMRGLPAELGPIAPQGGKAPLDPVDGLADDPGDVPEAALLGIFACPEMIAQFDDKIDASSSGCERRPWSTRMPGASGRYRASGRSAAAAFMAYAPEMGGFGQGRDFAAWPGLVPGRHSTGGKTLSGHAGKMGQSDMRQPLVGGAIAAYRPRRGRVSIPAAGLRACWTGCRRKTPR